MTLPPDPAPSPQSNPPSKGARFRQIASSGILLLSVLVCVFATVIGVSAIGGYVAGQKQRNVSATQTTEMGIAQQYQLGLSDLDAGNYEMAAERLRWVIEHSPNYPGAADALARAQQGPASASGSTAVPTLIPSTSENPDELFAEAQTFSQQQDWANTIDRLKRIQNIDASYHNIEVKEMLYTAYSTLGVAYIRGDRMEEGIILLEQAEKIRPLDDQVGGERNLARFYLDGKTYWGLDWHVVILNFEAIYEIAPDYRDVREKLWEAYVKWGDQLALSGVPCDGVTQYDNALAIRNDSILQEKRDAAEDACLNPTPLPTATEVFGIPGGETPTSEPTSDLIP
jgi:tetratricopeptide (TPR) repeat protein